MRTFALFVAGLFAVLSVHAQSVRWESGDSGDASELQLIFDDCAPEGEPQIPRMEGTTLILAGTASQTTMNNFNFSRSTIMTYRARAQKSGPIQIPTFTVQTNKGAIRVPAFNGGAARSAADANITSRLEPGSNSVWAGEVFLLSYVLDVPRRSFNGATVIDWNPVPLTIEDWSKFEPNEVTVGGESRFRLTSTTRAYAKVPGAPILNAATQLVNIQTGSIGFGLFQTPRIEQLSVTSNRPTLAVRSLPPPPNGFSGAVGQFKVTSKVVPTNAVVGEPVTWTLELSGTGNWPDIAGLPGRDVSKDFNVVQPQAKRTPVDGKLFEATLTEDVVLVPTREGKYTLGPVEFVYFDPTAGTYKTASTPRTAVTIAPIPPSATTPAAPSNAASPAGPRPTGEVSPPHSEVRTPSAPQGIPRDPITGSDRSLVPLSVRRLTLFVLLPFLAVPLTWLWLALRRAQRTDPARPRREAHARLAGHLRDLRSATDAARTKLLLQWQHDTAVLWGISQAAPAPLALTDPVWAKLWSESDQALYSSARTLPTDWVSRAETALAGKRVKSFSALRLFLPQNLLPFVAALTSVISLAPFAGAADADSAVTQKAGDAAYRAGDFAAAEKAWTDALAINPADPIARYNLSLALAQQDRWGEATAHATASFVQRPADSPARWQIVLAADKAGFLPAPVSKFLPPGPLQTVAGLASPGRWQMVLIASSVVFSGALSLLLLGLYRPRSLVRMVSALVLLGLGNVVAFASISSLNAYGVSADPRAVLAWRAGVLRSIPTEADTTQKTTPLSAGTAAIADKTFLGWTRLTFENGQTGWVRKEDVIGLWH